MKNRHSLGFVLTLFFLSFIYADTAHSVVRGVAAGAIMHPLQPRGNTVFQPVTANGPLKDIVVIPQSSLPKPDAAGYRVAHTFIKMMMPAVGSPRPRFFPRTAVHTTVGQPPLLGQVYNTPASLACIYGLAGSAQTTGACAPDLSTQPMTGGAGMIALVDAYDDPTAAQDLEYFSYQFGLPRPNFSVVYATGARPVQDGTGGWEMEESLDIEYAHAMAPNAKLVLVEAASDSTADLMAAVVKANTLVAAAGGGEVSMSWGTSEFTGETADDASFTTANITYFASAGDSNGVFWPSASPNVVSVGGTTIVRGTNNAFSGETAWSDTGGGASTIEASPAYQTGVSGVNQSNRDTPDVAFEADPTTGVWVYDSIPSNGASGWEVVGGTSLSSPAWAGVVNSSGNQTSTSAYLTKVYAMTSNTGFTDITSGSCGNQAAAGWDECTGNGSPYQIISKPVTKNNTNYNYCPGNIIGIVCRPSSTASR